MISELIEALVCHLPSGHHSKEPFQRTGTLLLERQ